MIDSAALLKDLKGRLKLLQADLRARADDPADTWGRRLQEEHAEARRRERTGHSWPVWRDNEVDQAAVAWIVATTFLRFCEDNDLLAGAHLGGKPVPVGWIAGPGERTARAEENLTAYFRTQSTHNRRHWLQQGFAVLAAQPAGKALVDPRHNPVWTAEISAESASDLITFWRRTDPSGALVHDFTDPELGTRFLGDLYQDLSEHAKKTYALLQTPVFVEEFILAQTLDPAINEFGLDGLKLIDPTCGSGHFLLGAFERLNAAWQVEAPALDPKERVRRAMDSIHGVDLNPFAVAIARFRLTVAGLLAAGERSLAATPELGFHLAIGDSLLGEQGGVPDTLDVFGDQGKDTFLYDAEDLKEYGGILRPGQYHVVVGNPPYIVPPDKGLRALYRLSYPTANRQYALSAPFAELFFRLAVRGDRGQAAGHVGQITANSFMKREFGKKLIEEFFGGHHLGNPVDLTVVIDTSGAYIPGHGTPTVILVGRRRRPVAATIRAVLGVRGEPGQPQDPSKGLVWTEIIKHLHQPGFDGKYVTVADLDRSVLSGHPWSLSGGGASDVISALGETRVDLLGARTDSIGFEAVTREDEVYFRDDSASLRVATAAQVRTVVTGAELRDWGIQEPPLAIFTYDADGQAVASDALQRALWPWREQLWRRAALSGTQRDMGLEWWEYNQLNRSRLRAKYLISFAFVATHNHYFLNREQRVFVRSAPVITLPEGASEEEHLELLGVLNSSTACFWLKQVSHDKGIRGEGGGFTPDDWERFYEFTGTKLEKFPLPATLPLERGKALDTWATELAESSPRATVERWLAIRANGQAHAGGLAGELQDNERMWNDLREQLIFEQEELDWEVYGLYGLVDDPGSVVSTGSSNEGLGSTADIVRITLGQRAFEIALARKVEAGDEETAWFERHKSTPITEMPKEWSEAYRDLVQRRLDLIESDPSIRLLEKPEFKRRWATTPWADQLTTALQSAILDRLEAPELWQDEQGPVVRTVAELADLLRTDEVLRELAAVLTNNPEPDLAAVIGKLSEQEAVPFLAAYRYKPSGLEKYRVWQATWDLQRREDAGEKVDIAVPPKYGPTDFRKPAYWKARGKLDVPKERFIAYPGLARESDSSPVLGWAGWDHRDQALALGRELPTQEALGADAVALTPMVAGLVELEPWLNQWHHEVDPTFGVSPAAAIGQMIDLYLSRLEDTRDQVTAWTPPAATRGRASKKRASTE